MPKIFTKLFTLRLAEQVGVAAVAAFAATLGAADGSVTKALLVAALSAAVRAAYGVVTASLGVPEQPSVK